MNTVNIITAKIRKVTKRFMIVITKTVRVGYDKNKKKETVNSLPNLKVYS